MALKHLLTVCLFFLFSSFLSAQEFYEWRVYRILNSKNQGVVSSFLEKAYIPALNRIGIDRIGVFTEVDAENDASIYMLIPYKTLDQFSGLNDRLEKDQAYHKSAATFFALDKKKKAYERIESSFMKAFKGMPVLEKPVGDVASRIFELRTYESHQSQKAKLKVEMFDEGEIDIMKNVNLGPVFFGEMLIGADVPNLTYMLSAKNMEEHMKHWEGFKVDPEWQKMKKMERYKGTVSKIKKWFLKPLSFSKI